MRNGLKMTLSMVAFAFTGMQAMAMAPIIGTIPSPIVGDEGAATGSAEFVYPDALNLGNYVTDSDGPSAIVWSYETSTTPIYSFNDAAPLGGSDDPLNPPAGAQITAPGQLDDADVDNDPATVTIRNVHLSPMAGGGTGDTGLPTGIVDAETQLVTLYASDGATYSSTDIFVYTDNDGNDRLSGTTTFEDVYAPGTSGLVSGASAWSYFTNYGTITSAATASVGMCMTAPAAGVNGGEWYSPNNIITLEKNTVYQARVNFTTNATLGQTPLFSLIWDNSDTTGNASANAYSSEQFILDNNGGATAPTPVGIAEHRIFFTPAAVLTAQWNAGAFTPAVDSANDMRLRFSMIDADGLGYGAESDQGQVCLKDIVVSRGDITGMVATPLNPAYDVENIDVTAAGGQTHTATQLIGSNTSISDAGGDLTILPPAGGWTGGSWPGAEIIEVRPGDTNNPLSTGGPDLIDNYPIPWTPNTLYMATWEMSAPNADSENVPPDVIRFGFDTPTQELNMTTQMAATLNNAGMPKQISGSVTAPQPYIALYYTQNGTASTTSEQDRVRPRVDIIIHDAFDFNGEVNIGGTRIHSEKVETVNVD